MSTFTEEQITALAPDPASLKAGKELADEKKWLVYAGNDRVMWGEVQGSGSTPYRTQIDLSQIAFKCSCPSRKFPCKHGIGLFILFARKPEIINRTMPEPPWVKEWIDKRTEKTPPKPLPGASSAPVDTTDHKKTGKQAKDREKRGNERLLKVQGGLAELELWLKDLIRTGLLTAPQKGRDHWQKTAARMVDAQASGLGNRVRELGEINYFSGNGWQDELLQQVVKLFLLIEAFRNIDSLPPLLQEDVRNLIGWSKSQKELLETSETETVRDKWLVLGRQTERQEDLTIQRDWLYGIQSKRYALILNFAYKNMPIPLVMLPGTGIEAELVFYPGSYPLRAVLKTQGAVVGNLPPVALLQDWEEAQNAYAGMLSCLPWAETIPLSISRLVPVKHQARWLLHDTQGRVMEIDKRLDEERIFRLLAYAGGLPLDITLLRSRTTVLPLGIWVSGNYRVI